MMTGVNYCLSMVVLLVVYIIFKFVYIAKFRITPT
jgi:hypothetical protein